MTRSSMRDGAAALGVSLAVFGGVIADGDDALPRGSERAEGYQTWGPYTAEGVAVTERNAERFGWAWEEFRIQPYVEAMVIYEDNLLANSGETRDETYTLFVPGVMGVYGNARGDHLYADYSMDFTSLKVNGNDPFDGQTFKVGGVLVDAKSRVGASHAYREVRDVDVQVGTRLKRQSNTTSASCDNRVSSKTSVGIEGAHALHRFEESAYSDYADYGVHGRMGWQMLPKTALSGRIGHGWVDLDERRDAYGSAQYDEVAIGVQGRPRPRLETSGEVGVQHRYFEDGEIEDITTEVGTLRVAGEPLDRFRVWLAGSAMLRPAIQAPGYTVLDTRLEPGISRRLFSERIVGGLSFIVGRSEYLGTGGDEGDVRVYDGRQDDYWGFNANLDWWIGRYWSVGAGYSYIRNESAADDVLTAGNGVDPASYEAGRWMLRVSFNR